VSRDTKDCVVVANGEFKHADRLIALVGAANYVIAADGGANWLASVGLCPDSLVGDLDSSETPVLRALEESDCIIKRHSRAKDETDTELAIIEAVELGAQKITIIGALGGRIDHEIANLQLLSMPELRGIRTVICDGLSHVSLLIGKGRIQGNAGDAVSLLPWGGDAHGIVTEGLQYPLRSESLVAGAARGVSNVLMGTVARVQVASGALLVVHTPRKYIEE